MTRGGRAEKTEVLVVLSVFRSARVSMIAKVSMVGKGEKKKSGSEGDAYDSFRDKPFIALSEPACGAGCMTLAFASVLREAGYSPHRYLWVSAIDIDPLAAGMAYIQLSLCGVAGEVVIGNSLNDERRRVLLTPAHYLGNWSYRLRRKSLQTA